MLPPGPPGYIDGTRPYFFRVGQSGGPIRSKTLMPRRAASPQLSARTAPRPNTPRVTPCLIRPLRGGGAGGVACAPGAAWAPGTAVAPATRDAVTAAINSLRSIEHLARSGATAPG